MTLIDISSNVNFQQRKTILARLIAGENVDIHYQPNVGTASFNLVKRIITLPLFKEGISNELTDLFVIHESGHALLTPAKEYQALAKNLATKHNLSEQATGALVNILEDIRINEILKNRYPGSRHDFNVGYRHRFERGDYGSTDINELNQRGLLDRLNMNAKISHVAKINFNAEEQVLVDEAMQITEWKDVETVANKIIQYVKENPQSMGGADGDLDMDGEEGGGQGMQIDLSGLSEEELRALIEKAMQAQTVESENDSMKAYIDVKQRQMEYKDMPEVNLNNLIEYSKVSPVDTSFREEGYQAWYREANKQVNHMISIFERKKAGETFRKEMINRTGVIDMNRIHKYKTHDDIFRRNTVTKDGKNHGFVFLLDTSGSMNRQMATTKKQVALMALFCRRMNVPYVFLTFNEGSWSNTCSIFDSKTRNNIPLSGVQLARIFDSNMKKNEFTAMLKRFVTNAGNQSWEVAEGGTPLNSAIFGLYDIVSPFVLQNNIDIMNVVTITDGQATDYIDGSIVFIDKKTGKKFYSKKTIGNIFETEATLQLLRARLLQDEIEHVNMVNFFLSGNRNETRPVEISKERGYDKKFIINTNAIDNPNDRKHYKTFIREFAETISQYNG